MTDPVPSKISTKTVRSSIKNPRVDDQEIRTWKRVANRVVAAPPILGIQKPQIRKGIGSLKCMHDAKSRYGRFPVLDGLIARAPH